MKKLLALLVLLSVAVAVSFTAIAQDNSTTESQQQEAQNPSEATQVVEVVTQSAANEVKIAFTARQDTPFINNRDARDTYDAIVSSVHGTITHSSVCNSARQGMGVGKLRLPGTDESCEISTIYVDSDGNDSAQSLGSLTIDSDTGEVDYGTMTHQLLPIGTHRLFNTSYSGSVIAVPALSDDERVSNFLQGIFQNVGMVEEEVEEVQEVEEVEEVSISVEVDVIEIKDLKIPEMRFDNSSNCTMNGEMIYYYATARFIVDIDVDCNDEESQNISGTMVFDENDDGVEILKIATIVLPSDFGSADQAASTNTSVPTLDGVLTLNNSGETTGDPDWVWQIIDADGYLIGTDVSFNTVMSLARFITNDLSFFFGL